MPLPIMFDGFVEERKRVSPICHINFDRNRYSVPASFANRPVSLRIYPERLVVVAEGHVVCTHQRIIERSHRLPGALSMTGAITWRSSSPAGLGPMAPSLATPRTNGGQWLASAQARGAAQWRTIRRDAGTLPQIAGEDTTSARRRPRNGRYFVLGAAS